MSLEAIYFASRIVAAIAIVCSLIFVGIQVRQSATQTRLNTQAVRASFHHAIANSFNNLTVQMVGDPELAEISRRSIVSAEPLDEHEQFRADFLTLAYLRVYETLYYERRFDASDGHLFEAEMRTLRWYATLPNFQRFWSTNPISFSDEFRAFVQALVDEHQAETKALHGSDSPSDGG